MERVGPMSTWIQRRSLLAVAFAVVCALAALLVFRPGQQASAGVTLSDPTAWIEHGLEGELLQVNGATGEVVARIDVAEPGEKLRAVVHGSGAAVLNQTTGTVSLVNATSLSVTQTIDVDLSDGAADRSIQVFGGQAESDSIAIVDEDQVLSVDTQTDVISVIALPEPLISSAQRPIGQVVVLPTNGTTLQQLGPNGLDDLASLPEAVGDSDERTVVRTGGEIWMIDPERLSAVEISPAGELGAPVCVKSSANGALVGGSADIDDAMLVGYNAERQMVSVTQTDTGDCSEFDLELDGDRFGPPVVRAGIAFVPNWGAGRIEVIDLDTAQRLRSVPFGTPGTEFDLTAHGSLVWANDRLGPFAAVVSEAGFIPVSKLEAIVAGAVEVNDDGDGDGDSLIGADIDRPGLRIIGNSGEQVITADGSQNGGSGSGNSSETSDEANLDNFGEENTPQPDAIGIAVQGPAEPDPQSSDQTPQPTTKLIANFGVSTATAKVGEVVRFTDFSSGQPTSWTWDFGDGTGAQEPDVEKSWDTEGVYLVELLVRNAAGDESVLTTEVTVVPETVLIAPTADFVFDRDTIEEGESVTFESRTVGDADLLEWDFGDGNVARGPLVEHTYARVGIYTVTLTATNPAGATSNSTTITVVSSVDPPQAVIAALPSKVVTGQFVTLQSASLNEPTRLRWDLGDGTSGSGSSVRHAWSTPGNYRVRLTVENSAGSDATFVDVAVARRVDPPVSQFTQSSTDVLVGEAVSFTSLSLNEPTRLVWNFGDDTTAQGATASKSWSKAGTYRVTLRASNEAGTNQTGVNITVVKPVDPPIASFTAGPLVVAPGDVVSFQDTSANNPSKWSWDFGDTGVSNNANTTHVYTREGTYTAKLTVSNEGGSSTAERSIVVKPPPSANFRWETDDRSVKFTDTSWDDPQSWSWDFGDGTTSTRRSPSHEFERGGAYEVTLTVSNDAGVSTPKTQTVRVGVPPVPAFTCTAEDAILTCDASASENVVSYRWRSADSILNSTPGQVTTSFAYGSSGRFDVTLEVTSASGETDSLTKRSPNVDRARAPRVTNVRVASRDQNLVRLEAVFDRNPTSWEWSVEGAELVEGGNTSTPLFRVPTNGKYRGEVRVSNDFGDDDDDFTFTVDTLVTQAAFDWEIVKPGVVRFTNRSIARPDAAYEWSFRGSAVVLDDNPAGPTVEYPTDGGTYTVILEVRDANGDDRLTRRVELPDD